MESNKILMIIMIIALVILIIAIIVMSIIEKKKKKNGGTETPKAPKEKKKKEKKKKSSKDAASPQGAIPDSAPDTGEAALEGIMMPQNTDSEEDRLALRDMNTGVEYVFDDGKRVVIGRLRELNDIYFVNDMHMSEQHCYIEKKDDSYLLYDYRSSNGTYCDGHKVEEYYILKDKSIIQVGNQKIQIKCKN